jgi:hypothetical protein
MAAAVARQEHRLGTVDAAESQIVGGLSPGRGHGLLANVLKSGQVIDA